MALQQDKRFWQQHSRTETAKSEYEKSLAMLNMRIDIRYESEYLPLLILLQQQDESMIAVTKGCLEKFTRYLTMMGQDFERQGREELAPAAD